MMLLGTLVPGVLAVAFFLHAATPDTIDLEWHFVAGQPFFEETETSARARGAGDRFLHHTYVIRWLPLARTDAGAWVIERRLERLKVESEVAGSRLVIYDSARPETNSAIFAGVYHGLVGWQSTLTLTPQYRIAALTVPAPPQGGSPAADVADFFEETAHRALIESLLLWAQPRRVREGDAWVVERVAPAARADRAERYTIRYDGRDGALACLRAAVTLQPPARADNAGGGPARALPQAQGIAWFDRQQRRLSRLETYLDPQGNVIVLARGGAEGIYPARRITRILDTLPE